MERRRERRGMERSRGEGSLEVRRRRVGESGSGEVSLKERSKRQGRGRRVCREKKEKLMISMRVRVIWWEMRK